MTWNKSASLVWALSKILYIFIFYFYQCFIYLSFIFSHLKIKYFLWYLSNNIPKTSKQFQATMIQLYPPGFVNRSCGCYMCHMDITRYRMFNFKAMYSNWEMVVHCVLFAISRWNQLSMPSFIVIMLEQSSLGLTLAYCLIASLTMIS